MEPRVNPSPREGDEVPEKSCHCPNELENNKDDVKAPSSFQTVWSVPAAQGIERGVPEGHWERHMTAKGNFALTPEVTY